MIDLAALAASTVALLTSLLRKALQKGAEKAGEDVASTLVESLKHRLHHAGAENALSQLAVSPDDPDAQAALTAQLRKVLRADPHLADRLQDWMIHATPAVAQPQIATASDHSTVIQIQGSHNVTR